MLNICYRLPMYWFLQRIVLHFNKKVYIAYREEKAEQQSPFTLHYINLQQYWILKLIIEMVTIQ